MKRKQLEKIVWMYMKALGKEKISIECWKRIAKVNQLILNGKNEK